MGQRVDCFVTSGESLIKCKYSAGFLVTALRKGRRADRKHKHQIVFACICQCAHLWFELMGSRSSVAGVYVPGVPLCSYLTASVLLWGPALLIKAQWWPPLPDSVSKCLWYRTVMGKWDIFYYDGLTGAGHGLTSWCCFFKSPCKEELHWLFHSCFHWPGSSKVLLSWWMSAPISLDIGTTHAKHLEISIVIVSLALVFIEAI